MGRTILTGIGHLEVLDAAQGARDVIRQCELQLEGRTPSAALLFANVDLDHQAILDTILEAWPAVQLIGCSSDGEFSSRGGYTQDSILLVALASDTVEFTAGAVEHGSAPSYRDAVREARARVAQDPAFGLVFTDGLTLNGEDALRGLDEAFGGALPIVGGAAADGWRFTGTRQFHGRRVLADAAVFLLLCGRFRFAVAVKGGWKPIGRIGVVTRASGKVVQEIDGGPAQVFYQELMGDAASPSVETPTAVYDRDGRFRFLRTSYAGTDALTGAITFFASIPEGSRVRLTHVTRDSIVMGAEKCVEEALEAFGGEAPDFALCTSCAARRVILGSRTVDECRAARRVLGDAVPVAGFYGFAEFSPTPAGTQFNNESYVTLLLG